VRLCGCRLLLALLRSVGVGGDEVFEIQDGSGMAAANRGRLNGKALWLVLRQSCGFGFQQQETFEMFWGMCRVPVHDLAGPLS
jgi:hypothetical protein